MPRRSARLLGVAIVLLAFGHQLLIVAEWLVRVLEDRRLTISGVTEILKSVTIFV
jgi:hypothetical protein